MQILPTDQFQSNAVVLDRLGLPPIDEFPMVVAAHEVRLTPPPAPAEPEETKASSASASPTARASTPPAAPIVEPEIPASPPAPINPEEEKIEEPIVRESARSPSPPAGTVLHNSCLLSNKTLTFVCR